MTELRATREISITQVPQIVDLSKQFLAAYGKEDRAFNVFVETEYQWVMGRIINLLINPPQDETANKLVHSEYDELLQIIAGNVEKHLQDLSDPGLTILRKWEEYRGLTKLAKLAGTYGKNWLPDNANLALSYAGAMALPQVFALNALRLTSAVMTEKSKTDLSIIWWLGLGYALSSALAMGVEIKSLRRGQRLVFNPQVGILSAFNLPPFVASVGTKATKMAGEVLMVGGSAEIQLSYATALLLAAILWNGVDVAGNMGLRALMTRRNNREDDTELLE